ncbi:hypothetical protein DSO57_1013767 [Entomophthora muscae]|uniref:Uncharacterized protein n=1 Tax=Entomophthora muscae TaxID=34485 RepID=A0ACC2S802_9FUNG|nr:hypothetical protein DSO57_1013767 [Entomophthora muscae]
MRDLRKKTLLEGHCIQNYLRGEENWGHNNRERISFSEAHPERLSNKYRSLAGSSCTEISEENIMFHNLGEVNQSINITENMVGTTSSTKENSMVEFLGNFEVF